MVNINKAIICLIKKAPMISSNISLLQLKNSGFNSEQKEGGKEGREGRTGRTDKRRTLVLVRYVNI